MKTIQIFAVAAALGALFITPGAAGQTGFTTLYTFTKGNPSGVTAGAGVLYGVGSDDSPCGDVFELQPPATQDGPWNKVVLYAFSDTNGDACGSQGAPVVGPGGALYGVSGTGGAYHVGGVWELKPPANPGGEWTESVIYNFTDLTLPFGLIVGPGGVLYIGTNGGGYYGAGTLFELQPPGEPGGAWSGTILYTFLSILGEGYPESLTMGPDGVFYGTIPYSGTTRWDAGAVFELTPPAAPGGAWTETVIANFHGRDDGATPNSITIGPDGVLYGTCFGTETLDGGNGPYGVGMVFQLTPPATPAGAWTRTTLQQFGPGNFRGPDSPLIYRHGNLYGASSSVEGGVVFVMRPPGAPGGAWTTTYLHHFTDGQTPADALVLDRNGNLYRTTRAAQTQPPQGTAYRIATR